MYHFKLKRPEGVKYLLSNLHKIHVAVDSERATGGKTNAQTISNSSLSLRGYKSAWAYRRFYHNV